jgi:hypothetical protein
MSESSSPGSDHALVNALTEHGRGTAPVTNLQPAHSEWNFNTIMTVLISLRFLLSILIEHPPPSSRDPDEYTAWLMNIIGLVLDYVRKNSRPQFDKFDRSYKRWKAECEIRE